MEDNKTAAMMYYHSKHRLSRQNHYALTLTLPFLFAPNQLDTRQVKVREEKHKDNTHFFYLF